MRFSIYQDSRIGGRAVNQDRMGYTFTKEALLLVLCDGMGGHFGGEVAAHLALQTINERFVTEARPILRNPSSFLAEAMNAAHEAISDIARLQRMPESPRTTVVAAVIQHGSLFFAHAGDSRLYLFRDGLLQAKTRDHSKLELLQSQGLLTTAQSNHHPDRNKLFNCLGSPYQPIVEHGVPLLLKPKDALLLCSDGLWSNLSDTIIGLSLTQHTALVAVPQLIELALSEGAAHCDNVTGLGLNWLGEQMAGASGEGVRSTVGLRQDGFESTLSLRPELTSNEVLTEAEIDAAVEEIRQAIRQAERRSSL